MTQFLIVYDVHAGRLVEVHEFADEEREVALAERFRLEHAHRGDPHLEIVVLGAATRGDLERTHGRYFKTVAELASEH